jgi:class 3 adenylate cyclase
MVSSIFDNTAVGAEFRDFMHARSEGNPFVLEEMLKAAIDRGDIYRDEADWQRKPISELRMPKTVRDSILLRVERLEATQAEILRCAAVLGRSFDYQTLIRLSEQDRMAVETALQTAVQQQLLEVEETDSSGRYRFRHALTQEAIYNDLSVPTRERLHSAAADVLAEGAETPRAEVAFHLRNAHRWQEAIQVTMQAAAAAEAGQGYGEAAALYSLLLPVVTTGIDRARLLCRLGEAYWMMGTPAKAVEPLEEAVRQLNLAGEPVEAARHRLTLGRCFWEGSNPARARAEYEQALETLQPLGPSRELALAYIRLCGLHIFDYRPARQLAEKAISTADSAGAEDMRIWGMAYLGLARAYEGETLEGIEVLEQSAREALDRGLYNIGGNALHNVFALYVDAMQMDKLQELIPRLEAVKMERWGTLSRLWVATVWANQVGEVERALSWAKELRDRAAILGDSNYARLGRLALAHQYLELARYDDARELLTRPSASAEAQETMADAWVWMRFHLAIADLPRAVEGAEVMLTLRRPNANDDCMVAVVETFVAAGRLEDANTALVALQAMGAPSARQGANEARARIALALDDPGKARPAIQEAISAFHRAGIVLRELNARRVLAKTYIAEDNAGAAEAEFRYILDASRRLGLRRLEILAEEGLAGLGIAVDRPAPAPESTENVHAPAELGERLVTVMFADVRGYTAMVGERPPVEVVDLVATYQRWAAQEVERHLGVVDKFAGDAVMATFNVSGDQVDHAAHALKAAMALRDKAGMLGLPVGIGIATGSAVVGTLKTGANLSVIGETTNLASRLQSQAAAGEVLLSEESYRRVRDAVEAAPEQLSLKGFDRPVAAYRVPAPQIN